MRLPSLFLALVTLLTTAACSDPKCQPDEVLVGITCRQLSVALPDGSTEVPAGFTRFDGSVNDAAAETRSDASTSQRDGGDGGEPPSPADPDALLEALPGGPPTFQFRADTVTLSNGNVATIPNRRGSDALVLAAGTLAAPAGDALFAGAPSIAFAGTQWLDSDLAASAWKFLSDGTGCEVFLVVARTGVGVGTAPRIVTTIGGTGPGFYITQAQTPVTNAVVNNYNGAAFSFQLTDTGALPLNAATYIDSFHQEDEPSEAQAFWKETATASATTSNAPSPSNAQTLRLGGGIDEAWNFEGRFAELLVFPRALHEYERQIVREYIEARYGIAAPRLTDDDRNVLSMMPFSWLRADANAASAGKLTALLDKARPGHTLTPPVNENQADAPRTDASFGGQSTVTFSGAQWYSSTLPGGAWSFLGNGMGAELYFTFMPTSAAATQVLLNTANGTNGADWFYNTSQLVTNRIFGAGSLYVPFSVNTAGYLHHFSKVGAEIEWSHSKDDVPATSATATLAGFGTGAASGLRIGAQINSNALPASMRWADLLVFDRLLSAAERERVQMYLRKRYALAPR